MSDFFIRDRINDLTGLTKYSQVNSGGSVGIQDQSWVDIFTTVSTTTHHILSAYKLTLDADGGDLNNTLFRILAAPAGEVLDNGTKIFPYGDSIEILSGVDQVLQFQLQIPKAHDFKLQVWGEFSSGTPTVELDYLSIVTMPTYNHN